jgi:septum site-determining protein MinC
VRELRARRLTPVGVQGGTAAQGVAAFSAGLVTLRGGRDVALEAERPSRPAVAAPEIDRTPPDAESARAPAPRPAEGGAGGGTVLVTEPVRSGQRIHAPEGDLVVVTSVSPGAELVARGSIHVYGPLRGRALAGVDGDAGARIFCQSLQAELIAIAGVYRTSDDLGAEVVGDRVQAFLRDGALVVETIR